MWYTRKHQLWKRCGSAHQITGKSAAFPDLKLGWRSKWQGASDRLFSRELAELWGHLGGYRYVGPLWVQIAACKQHHRWLGFYYEKATDYSCNPSYSRRPRLRQSWFKIRQGRKLSKVHLTTEHGGIHHTCYSIYAGSISSWSHRNHSYHSGLIY
jgi:hypothetical protein